MSSLVGTDIVIPSLGTNSEMAINPHLDLSDSSIR